MKCFCVLNAGEEIRKLVGDRFPAHIDNGRQLLFWSPRSRMETEEIVYLCIKHIQYTNIDEITDYLTVFEIE